MSKGRTRMWLHQILLDPDFIDRWSDRKDVRKTFRAVRKRRLREAELQIRRDHALKKKFGIK
ncbi:MAG: hypothetical protein IH606_20005 [Burkholderiales bacterium]|nr:hypothetical protein [Burkholderiales bacterium]